MTKDFKTKDSGKRRSFKSGAVRDVRTGKGRYDLLSPLAIDRLAKLYERGAEKYKARNWEAGMELSVYLDSGLRHFFEVLEGRKDEDHAAAVMWNIAAFIHVQEQIERGNLPADLDDLPDYTPKKKKEIGKTFQDEVMIEYKKQVKKKKTLKKSKKKVKKPSAQKRATRKK